jgi:hypothetical protein
VWDEEGGQGQDGLLEGSEEEVAPQNFVDEAPLESSGGLRVCGMMGERVGGGQATVGGDA